MKLRTVTAAMALVLATAGLSACTTKVGLAATVNGKRVTDSDLVSYMTPSAAVNTTDSAGAKAVLPARSFVLQIIIEDRLFSLIASRLPSPGLPEKQIQSEITKVLADHSSKELTTSVAGASGFKAKFNDLFTHVYVLNQIFEGLSQQAPTVLNQALKGLKFPVQVSPSYGTWDPKTYSLDSSPNAGYPTYMTFAPSPSATPGS